MSPLLVALAVVSLVYLLSQFGGRLAARSALVWWLVVGFFLFSAVVPSALRPIADAFGIEYVSNLVLASMVVFLLYQTVEQMAVTTQQGRGVRRLVSRLAMEEFVAERARRGAPAHMSAAMDDAVVRALVVLPCYNEEGALPAILDALEALPAEDDVRIDFCVVDDGSVDASARILAARAPGHFVSHKANVGVAGVLLTGFQIAAALEYDYAVQCDADGQHPVAAIPALVRAARDLNADLTIGSRFARAEDGVAPQPAAESSTWIRRIGGLMLVSALRVFGRGAAVSDPTSGFRVYSRTACASLVPRMPDEYPEPETVALVALTGGTISEWPVRMTRRETGESSITGWGSGRYMVKTITAILGLRLRSILTRR